jgi:hypothetical protein
VHVRGASEDEEVSLAEIQSKIEFCSHTGSQLNHVAYSAQHKRSGELMSAKSSCLLSAEETRKATKGSITLLTYVIARGVKQLGTSGVRALKHDSLETGIGVKFRKYAAECCKLFRFSLE